MYCSKIILNFTFFNLITVIFLILSLPNDTKGYTSEFESFCGEVALGCIKNCQVFKHKCGASYVAEVVKNANPGRISSDLEGDWNSPNFSNSITLNQVKYQDTCKSQGNVCVVVREYERSECCPGHYCVPFERRNGQIAAIGSCKRLEYRDKINPRNNAKN